MKTESEVEQEYDLKICRGAGRWQAFREGNSRIGYGDTPELAAIDWKAKQRPCSFNCGVTL